jgi:hypothetical protein
VELQRQLKEARTRACNAESQLAWLEKHSQNELFHRDGVIENLKMHLRKAEARIHELERLYCPDKISERSQFEDIIPFME